MSKENFPSSPPYPTVHGEPSQGNFQPHIGFNANPPPPPPYSPSAGPYGTDPVTMPYPPSAPTVTVVSPVTPLSTMGPLGPNKSSIVCPHCNAQIVTTVKKSPSNLAYISALVICMVGCFCGCCLIPLCIDSCKSSEHTCPNCNRFLGRYSKN